MTVGRGLLILFALVILAVVVDRALSPRRMLHSYTLEVGTRHNSPRPVQKGSAPYSPSNSRVLARSSLGHPRVARLATDTASITVVAYNIAHGRGGAADASNFGGGTKHERARRLEAIGRLLRAQDADVVVLNEVDFNSIWSGNVNQARFIAKKAGFRYVVEQRNIDVGLGPLAVRFGNAIFSRHPISDCEPILLPAASKFESLVAGRKKGVVCTVGERFRLVAVHLEHRYEAVRVDSAKMINQLPPTHPTILAGDVNSTRTGYPKAQKGPDGSTALDVLTSAYRGPPSAGTVPQDQLTFPSAHLNSLWTRR